MFSRIQQGYIPGYRGGGSVLTFDQAQFEKALATPRLRQPLPEFLPGAFIQCHGFDRYYFNREGRMYEGDTSHDIFEATQAAGILPRDDSRIFRALLRSTKLIGTVRSMRQKVPLLGKERPCA